MRDPQAPPSLSSVEQLGRRPARQRQLALVVPSSGAASMWPPDSQPAETELLFHGGQPLVDGGADVGGTDLGLDGFNAAGTKPTEHAGIRELVDGLRARLRAQHLVAGALQRELNLVHLLEMPAAVSPA